MMEDTILFNESVGTVPCPVCGSPNPADSQFCVTCGRQMNAPTMSQEEPAPVFVPEMPQKPKKPVAGIVITAIIAAMLLGRLVWGAAAAVLYGMAGKAFGLPLFITSGFVNAVPGIILQLIAVPALVRMLEKARLAK